MIYSGTTIAKNNETIPLFKSGKPVHSKYNPNAEKTILPEDFSGCVIIAGIGAGFHIENLAANSSVFKIIAVEEDFESLEFSKNFPAVKRLTKNSKITFCTAGTLEETLISTYLPCLYKNLTLSFLRSWENEDPNMAEKIRNTFSSSIKKISADYSVQVHFGKLWHKNILENLKFISENRIHNFDGKIDSTEKVAAIIAAGPSLETSIKKLKANRNNYFIVATDTAFGTMLLEQITPDAVVSVDAQHISSEHFFCCSKSHTIFVFDICANPEAVRLVSNRKNQIHFIRSGHPLSAMAAKVFPLPLTETGSGTVTIAAADWARQMGFSSMEFFGADFSYSDGKPYCRGTYLEKKFLSVSKRLLSSENLYTALMYRTEIEKTTATPFCAPGKNAVTSEVLKSYGTTLLQWVKKHGYEKKGAVIRSKKATCTTVENTDSDFDFKRDFFTPYFVKIENFYNGARNLENSSLIQSMLESQEMTSLLPLLATYKNTSLFENISLAYNFLLYYNS